MLPACLALLALALQEPASPEARRAMDWEDFPVFVWRTTHAGKPLPEALAEPFGGVILMRGEDSGWARERGLGYLVWNVAGRDALHLDADEAWNARVEQWIRTRDPKWLVREPCLNDPRTVEGLFTTLEATIAKHGEHPGLGFVLGDEVSLTPNGDPFDLCRCDFCEAQWKEYARKKKLPERAPLTDEVRLALLEDDFSSLGPWLARRRLDADLMEHQVLRLRERVLGLPDSGALHPGEVRRIPGAPQTRHPRVGLLGVSGSTAFGGFDLSSTAALFDFVEAYPVTDARESFLASDHVSRHGIHGSTGPPSLPRATLATIFVASESPDGAAWRIWEHWLRGGAGVVLWSDEELERSPEHRARLAEAVRDIRALQERGIRPQLEQHGGALVLDPDSQAASFLREALLDGPSWPRRRSGYQAEHGLRERKVRSWLRLIEDCGELPVSLPLRALREDCAYEYTFLVLPETLVLDESDVLHLEQFLAGGGTLIVDGTLGWVDRKGHPWSTSVLERLRSKAPERVLAAPTGMESYLDTRLDARRGEQTRAFLRPLLESRPRTNLPEAVILPDLARGGVPWLVNRHVGRREAADGFTLVMLPNLVDAAERQQLRAIDLRSVPSRDIRWIHPSDGKTLRAGDAAVFVNQHFGRLEKPR